MNVVDELCTVPAWLLARQLRAKELDPRQLIDAVLKQAERVGAGLGAFISIFAEYARKEADIAPLPSAERPLAGLPVSVKDDLFTEGLRTTGGCAAFENFMPPRQGPAIARLREAGAIVFGKTNLSELAMSFAHGSSLAGPCRNPWDPRRSAGASSSGSACAVAAGIGPISIATDTGGSIRYPAALCGVVGFSPSSGRVPRHGNFGVNHFLVSIGVVARSVRDAANVLGVMSGPDPSDPSTLPYTAIDAAPFERPELPVLRVGRVRGYAASFCPAPAITALMEQALHLAREAGWSIAPVDFVVDEAFDAFEVISDCDRLALMCSEGTLTEERERLMSPAVVTRLKRARTRSGVDYARALEVRRKLQGRVDRLFEQFDLVVSPTVAAIAPLLHESGRVASDEQPPCDALWWTNLVGCPAASLPIGCVEGLPSAMHLVARPGADELLLVACGQLERELGYWDSGFPVAGAASPTCTHVRPAQASGVVRRCQ